MSDLPSPFRTAIEFSAAEVVLDLSGELDALHSPDLDAVLQATIDRGHRLVVLNLAGLDFMGAAGFGVIASKAHRLRLSQGELVLRAPSAMIRRNLEITGLAGSFRIESPEGERAQRDVSADLAAATESVGDRTSRQRAARVVALAAVEAMAARELRVVVNLARAAVVGADGVSVSLLRDGRMTTAAASDQIVREMDAGQEATGEGPCLSASREGRRFSVAALGVEARWPAFVPIAQALGIQAILSTPLRVGGSTAGALNIYSRAVSPFGAKEELLASAFALEASRVLSSARLVASDDSATDWRRDALRARQVIAQAEGVLMERAGVSEMVAFDHLRRFSERSGRPLRERAEDIVTSARMPGTSTRPEWKGDDD